MYLLSEYYYSSPCENMIVRLRVRTWFVNHRLRDLSLQYLYEPFTECIPLALRYVLGGIRTRS